jgi:hypothetical protein
VTEGIATLKEIDERYSFNDIMKANAVLDMKSEIEKTIGEVLAKRTGETS